MNDFEIKRCDSIVREYCPDRETCPKWATFLDGSECDYFNRNVTERLRKGVQPLSPFAARVKELMKADSEGRVVVLACPIGTDVFMIHDDPCSLSEVESCLFACNGADPECEGYDGERNIVKVRFAITMQSMVGKRIFLTEAEAQQALEKWKEGRHDRGRLDPQ